jgi:hypothetical protein
MTDRASEEKLADILQPSTQARAFTITLVFGTKMTADYQKAVDLARKNPTYAEEGEGEWRRHSVTFTSDEVDELFELFNIVHAWDTTEVLVNHKALPYGHQLWLPLMWFYRIR